MKLYIADAFTKELFGGNPAGVVILDDAADFPSEATMQKTAAELRYSETAFIKKLSDDEFHLRYFTPAGEVDLCGHATIASFYCLLTEGIVSDNSSYKYKTLAGDLGVTIKNKNIMMDMASPQLIGKIEDQEAIHELYDIMGGSPEGTNLTPLMISTGLPDIMMPVKDHSALNALAPDMQKLTELSKKYNVVGVHAFCLGEGDVTAYCRNFAPLYDIDEEAATGTSNGALTYYLYKNEIIKDGAESVIIQGEAMNRPSEIRTALFAPSEDDVSIKVGGSAVILAKGEICIK